jgi:chemotaxis protein MotB
MNATKAKGIGRSKSVLAVCAGALAGVVLTSGCASNSAYRQTLDEREHEIKSLREERTGLKGEMRDLNYQKDTLETALAEANARLVEEPKKEAGQSFPDLDRVGVGYGTRDGEMVLSIPNEISFASGKAELSKQGRTAMEAVAKTLMREYPEAEYWIEGHTDSDPIVKSKFATNRDLSLARAMAVLHFVVEDAGVPDGRCVVAGWGEYRPLAANDTQAHKAKNRRVEIVVHKPAN